MTQLYLTGLEPKKSAVFESLYCRDISIATPNGRMEKTQDHPAFKCENPANLLAIYFEKLSGGSAIDDLDSLSEDSNKIYACSPEHMKQFIAYAQESYFLRFPDVIADPHAVLQKESYREIYNSLMGEELPEDFFDQRNHSQGIERLLDLWEREQHKFF